MRDTVGNDDRVTFVARSFEQWHSLHARSGNLLAVDKDRGCSRRRCQQQRHLSVRCATHERVCAGERELFILVRASCAAYSDTAYDLTIDYYRNSADQRSE